MEHATVKVNLKDNVSKLFQIMQIGGGVIVTKNKVVDDPNEITFFKLGALHNQQFALVT